MTERIDPRTTDLSRRDFLSAAAGLTLALTVTPDPLAILGVEDRQAPQRPRPRCRRTSG